MSNYPFSPADSLGPTPTADLPAEPPEIVAGTVRWDDTANAWVEWSGSAWVAVTSTPLVLPVTVANGGTGIATLTAAGAIPTAGASGTAAMVPLAAVAVGQVLVSGGAATIPAWAGTSVPLTGIAPQLVLGAVAASSSGAVDLKGLTSGTTRLTVPAAAGSVTVTLPTVATTGPAVQAATSGDCLVATTGGVQSYSPRAAVGVLVGRQYLTAASGTYTPTAGATRALFELVAGGGGGGGADSNQATTAGAGGGGGAGGYAAKLYTDLATEITYTVGTGGAGGAAGVNAGDPGVDTTSVQGATTVTAKAGAGGAAGNQVSTAIAIAGGAGGAVSTNGDLNAGGQPGDVGIVAIITVCVGGNGAPTQFGAGGAGGLDSAGGAGVGFGGGGGGGAAPSSGAADRAGGNGSPGVIVVSEWR